MVEIIDEITYAQDDNYVIPQLMGTIDPSSFSVPYALPKTDPSSFTEDTITTIDIWIQAFIPDDLSFTEGTPAGTGFRDPLTGNVWLDDQRTTGPFGTSRGYTKVSFDFTTGAARTYVGTGSSTSVDPLTGELIARSERNSDLVELADLRMQRTGFKEYMTESGGTIKQVTWTFGATLHDWAGIESIPREYSPWLASFVPSRSATQLAVPGIDFSGTVKMTAYDAQSDQDWVHVDISGTSDPFPAFEGWMSVNGSAPKQVFESPEPSADGFAGMLWSLSGLGLSQPLGGETSVFGSRHEGF